MTNSIRKSRSRKASKRKHFVPPKPYSEFPLTPHAAGKWMKKIRGKLYYFGRWGRIVNGKMERLPDDGWKEALELYKAQADDLHAGRTPRERNKEALTVKDLCNRFFTAKQRKMDAGEIAHRTFKEYEETTSIIVDAFGKDRLVDDLQADDFEKLRADLAKRWGPVRLGNGITRVKGVFKYAFDNQLIDRPVRFGSEFVKPSKAVIRKHKAAGGKKLFTADEIHRLLDAADVQMRAMILLGLNSGHGNTDVSNLQNEHIDLDSGWLDYPRPKTGIERRCPLWSETVDAIRAAIAVRPEPKDPSDADCVFVKLNGYRWVRVDGRKTDTVATQFGGLLRKLDINGRRGLGFYSLRHTHRTVADRSQDQVACNHIMGHSDNSMAANYTHHIDDDRLQAVTEVVREWLFSNG